MLAECVSRIMLSPTLRVSACAGQMRAQGIDVVDFSVGEPGFPTPDIVKNAAKAALDANFTKYTANTRAIILNYPSNSTSASYTREELEEFAETRVRRQIWVIADEIYEKLLCDGQRFTSITSLGEEITKRCVVINGFSKAFAKTGWRLGYAARPQEVIAACSKVQSHNTWNATSFAQKAAVVAPKECSTEVERMRRELERRRTDTVRRLRSLPEVMCATPNGAFYVVPNVSHYLGREFAGTAIRSTLDLSQYLLEEAHVAVVPGEAFGTAQHLCAVVRDLDGTHRGGLPPDWRGACPSRSAAPVAFVNPRRRHDQGCEPHRDQRGHRPARVRSLAPLS